jgi:prophage DNA circulation protein
MGAARGDPRAGKGGGVMGYPKTLQQKLLDAAPDLAKAAIEVDEFLDNQLLATEAERDAAIAERDAMRAVVEAAVQLREDRRLGIYHPGEVEIVAHVQALVESVDAYNAAKGGT